MGDALKGSPIGQAQGLGITVVIFAGKVWMPLRNQKVLPLQRQADGMRPSPSRGMTRPELGFSILARLDMKAAIPFVNHEAQQFRVLAAQQ